MSILTVILASAIGLFPSGTIYSYGNPMSIYPEGFVRERGQRLLERIVSQHKEKYSDGVLDCSLDDVHTGYYGQMSAADQVLGWVYRLMKTK